MFANSIYGVLEEESSIIEKVFLDSNTDLYLLLICLKYINVLVKHDSVSLLKNGMLLESVFSLIVR
jgi:hypothetical protein